MDIFTANLTNSWTFPEVGFSIAKGDVAILIYHVRGTKLLTESSSPTQNSRQFMKHYQWIEFTDQL